MHKKVQKHAKKQKKQNKIAGKRHKQTWPKKVGVDGQFEGLGGGEVVDLTTASGR